MKEELNIAKTILKDPNLSQLATRKFHSIVEQSVESTFLAKDAIINDIIEEKKE